MELDTSQQKGMENNYFKMKSGTLEGVYEIELDTKTEYEGF
jgi:hypothetical protein